MEQYMNEDDRQIVVVPEEKSKIQRIKEKYGRLDMDDKTAKKIRRLEITNDILKASSIIMGIATVINIAIPDFWPGIDEAVMAGITGVIGGASTIVQNKIDDLSRYGTTEVKMQEVEELSRQIGNIATNIKRKRAEIKTELETESYEEEATSYHK